jgi:hypothetical protein
MGKHIDMFSLGLDIEEINRMANVKKPTTPIDGSSFESEGIDSLSDENSTNDN